jgi:hypothetical protein
MPVLLRHSRHITGRSRSEAKQMQGTKQPRAKQPRMQNRRRACVPLHRSLCGGLGGWGLQVLWSLGVFRRAVRKRACCCSPVLKPLQVCPHDPPLLPFPPGEAPPRAAPAPPQAGHKRRRPAAPPCPGWPTAAALLAADPCKPARAACTAWGCVWCLCVSMYSDILGSLSL